MSDYTQVEANVKEVVAKELHMEQNDIRLESRLAEDLGMDSFSAIEMIFALEDKFHIKIPDDQMSQVKTIKDIVDYIAFKAVPTT